MPSVLEGSCEGSRPLPEAAVSGDLVQGLDASTSSAQVAFALVFPFTRIAYWERLNTCFAPAGVANRANGAGVRVGGIHKTRLTSFGTSNAHACIGIAKELWFARGGHIFGKDPTWLSFFHRNVASTYSVSSIGRLELSGANGALAVVLSAIVSNVARLTDLQRTSVVNL